MLPYFTKIKKYVIKPTCKNVSSFRYFFYEKTVKNAFTIFVFILMAGVFVSRDENPFLNLISLIIRKR